MLERSAGAWQANGIGPVLDREGDPLQWTAYVPDGRLAIADFGFGQCGFGT